MLLQALGSGDGDQYTPAQVKTVAVHFHSFLTSICVTALSFCARRFAHDIFLAELQLRDAASATGRRIC